jgi:uncharacterized protein
MEQPVVFTNIGQQLVGMVHVPAQARPLPAVVMYHGFTGHHIESHLLFVKMARALAKAGIGSLRFDFRGSGNSEGKFSDMTVSGQIDDAMVALDFLSTQSWVDDERIGILGLSLGGGIAAVVSGRDDRVKATVLLSAVARPYDDFAHLPPVDPVEEELSAMWTGSQFLEDLENFTPLEEIVKRKSAIMVVHGTDDTVLPCSRAEDYHKVLLANNIPHKVMIVPQADHTYSKKVHEDRVIKASVNWFLETL